MQVYKWPFVLYAAAGYNLQTYVASSINKGEEHVHHIISIAAKVSTT